MRLAFKSKDKSYHVLKKHQTRKLDRLNQPVTISDIVVRQSDKGRGEFQYKNPYRHMKFPTLKRMRDMVALVADIATEYHLQNHFSHDENGQRSLKEGHENEVTRLLFHEAAFYTPSPLTKKDFDKLLTAIERMASSLPENLYLLLSSFPVAINENHYVNQVVHVQCGAVPKLTIFTKITPSGFDPLFPNMKCIHYSSEKRKPVQDDLAMSVLPDNENTPVIDYSCTLKCQTSGGAEFFSVIEICKDHFFKEGYKSLNKQIDLMTEPRANELIPRQLLHTITSNWIDFVDDSMLTNKIVRADPIKGYDFGNHIPLVSLSAAFRAKVLQTSLEYQEVYKKMNLIMDSEVISIVNPPFGPPLTLFFYEAHQLSVLPADFLSRVDQHNERVIQQYSYQNCLLFNYPSAIIKEEKKEKGIKLTVKRVG